MEIIGGLISVKTISFLMFSVLMISAVGYALGRITIKGVSLGTAGVFIVAILYGCFFYPQLSEQLVVKASKETFISDALKIIENLGLILFVSAVGFIAGPKFFGNFKKNFKSYILLGVIIILVGGLAAVGCIYLGRTTGVEANSDKLTAMVVGLMSGALTSTPAFSSAKAAVGPELESIVSVGYGIAYIFGVIGVVLFVQLIPKIVKADMDKERELASTGDGSYKEAKAKVEKKFMKLDDFSFLPFFLAAGLGIIIGSIKIPLSGDGFSGTCFSLTTTGGCLLVALIFGHFGHIGKISIMPTEQTLKVFRELGLMLFLIGAGVSGGAKFVQEFKAVYFLYGAIITILPMIIGFLFAKYVLKLSLLNNLGSITGGMTSTPALGTLIHVAHSEDVAAAYAATYPIALISVVLVSQVIVILF